MKTKQPLIILAFVIFTSLSLHGAQSAPNFESFLEKTESLLERAINFNGDNNVVLQNILKDLDALKQEVPVFQLIDKIFAANADVLKSLHLFLHSNEQMKNNLDYFLLYHAWFCIKCLVNEKAYIHLNHFLLFEENNKKYAALKNILTIITSTKRSKRLTKIVEKSDHEYTQNTERLILRARL